MTPTSPDVPGTGTPTGDPNSLIGTWTSASLTEMPNPATCGNFQWTVTSQTATTLAGTFSATCAGNVTITGKASGRLEGQTIPMQADGAATVPGLPACNFDLTGTGYIEATDRIRIEYKGMTCWGPVHGTETVRKRSPFPNPAPAPNPPTPGDPLFGCGGIIDKEDLVICIHAGVNPPKTVQGAFEVTKRVAWALRGEGAGLLIKNGGENIVSWQGYSFSAGRICYPDGHIYKVLTDIPATNGPTWMDNEFVDPKLYVPAIDPTKP